jgi:ankyrin repeat protein
LDQEIIDRVNEKDDVILKEYYVLKLATSEIHIPIWKSLVWDLHLRKAYTWLQHLSVWTAQSSISKENTNKLKLFYVPHADLKPGKGSEISESALIRYVGIQISIEQPHFIETETPGRLLKDIDHDSKITQFQIYQSNGNDNWLPNFMRASTCFCVIKTTSKKDGEHWWSLDRNVDYIVLQRSRDEDAVKNKFGDRERKDVTFVDSLLVNVSGSINNLFNGNPLLLDFNNMFTSIPLWHPLCLLVFLGNFKQDFKLFDSIKKTTKFKHFNNKLNPLNFSMILPLDKLKMAAIRADKTEIFDFLFQLKKVKIGGCDRFGRTCLHFAAASSNVVAARHLINRGANPNLPDNNGLTPLHLAAYHSDDTEMIDLLLEAQKKNQGETGVDKLGNRVGMTALHNAAIASNEITAKRLIERGADLNGKDKLGRTPLHYAAFFAKNMDIIDVFLNDKHVRINSLDNDGRNALYYAEYNQHGLTKEIVNRLKEKEVTNRSDYRNTVAAGSLATQHSKEEKIKTFLSEKIKNAFVKGIERVNNEAIYTAAKSRGPQFKSEFKNGHIFSDLFVKCLIIFLNFFVIFILVNCVQALFNFYEIVIYFVAFITSIDPMHNLVPSSMSSFFNEPGIIPLKNIVQQIL